MGGEGGRDEFGCEDVGIGDGGKRGVSGVVIRVGGEVLMGSCKNGCVLLRNLADAGVSVCFSVESPESRLRLSSVNVLGLRVSEGIESYKVAQG